MMLRLLLLSLTDTDPIDRTPPPHAGAGNLTDQETEYSHEEFMEMSLADIEELTGVVRPKNSTIAEIEKYREKAWRSYQKDVTNREEWGAARQGDDPDDMERANGVRDVEAEAADDLAEELLDDDDDDFADDALHGLGDDLEDNYDDDYIDDDRFEDDNYEP